MNAFTELLEPVLKNRTIGDIILITFMVAIIVPVFLGFMAYGDVGFATTEQVQANTTAITSIQANVGAIDGKVSQLYRQSLGQDIFQQTKIRCSVKPGTPVHEDYTQRIGELRDFYHEATNGDYPDLSCDDLGK